MKAQSQIVSVIIIFLLAMAVIAAVLPWTLTMIQKKKDMKSLDDVYNFFQSLDESIKNKAKMGGEESLQLKVPGKFTIYPESSNSYLNNSIVFKFESLVSDIAECTGTSQVCWIPLNTPNTNITATLGMDPSAVIFALANKTDNKLSIYYRLWYRTLTDNSGRSYKIVFNTSGNTIKESTVGFLRIQRLGSREVQDKTVTEINIVV